MDYSVDYGELSRAAELAQAIADRTVSATSRMRLDLVATAIPGSVSAGRANAADSKLVEGAQGIERDLAGYAAALATTAGNYKAIEDTAEGAAREFFGGVS